MNLNDFFSECNITQIENSNHWHQMRKKGIGGSDAGIILNQSNYKTPYQLWSEKVGLSNSEFQMSEAIEKGNRCEQPLIDLFMALYPSYTNVPTKDISLSNKKYPFLHANLDSALISPDGRKGGLEIKSTTMQNMKMLDDWKPGRIPMTYYCQCLHYLLTTEFDFWILFAVLDFPWKDEMGQQETRVRVIERKNAVDDINYLFEQEKEFWRRVQENDPPEFLNKQITI